MLSLKLFAVIIYIIYEANAKEVFPFIKPCRPQDNECITRSIKFALPPFVDGVPEHNIPPSDPLRIKDIDIDSIGLKLLVKNANVYGLSKCHVITAERDIKANSLKASIECPIKVTGQYEANGKILFLEIVGDGDINVETEKIRIDIDVMLKTIVGPDGNKHWKFSGFDYKYNFIEKINFHLTNLFGGDKTKGNAFLQIINESWKETLPDIIEPIIKLIIKQLIININKLFLLAPINELEIIE